MKVYKVTLTDAMSDALIEQAASEGQAMRNGPATILRKALRYYLSKYGRRATSLDVDDAKYHSTVKIAGRHVPAGRKGIPQQHRHKESRQ